MKKTEKSSDKENAVEPLEKRLKDVEAIIRTLDNPETQLEKSLAEFERGMKIIKGCQEELEKAKTQVEKLTGVKNGMPEFSDIE